MPPEVRIYEKGKLTLTRFTFITIGDELPLHSHEEGAAHLTICRQGRLHIYGEGWQRELVPGDMIFFEPNQMHAYRALEAGSVIVNIPY